MVFKKKWTQGIHFFYILAFDLNYGLTLVMYKDLNSLFKISISYYEMIDRVSKYQKFIIKIYKKLRFNTFVLLLITI